ncbi:MAG: hypothetical protein ACRCT6_03975, partial [Notoacmeibacter sp.]
MASCLTIVNSALRKLGVLASGREARPVDRDDAFQQLVDLYRQLVSQGAFGRLRDVIPQADYTAFGNERIFRNHSATLQITLPETVANWQYWNDRYIFGIYPNEPSQATQSTSVATPRDCSVVSIIDAFVPGVYDFIYDGQVKQWQGLYDLSITSEAPLSFRDPQGLAAMLAVQMADETSGEIGPSTLRQAQSFMTQLTSRFS